MPDRAGRRAGSSTPSTASRPRWTSPARPAIPRRTVPRVGAHRHRARRADLPGAATGLPVRRARLAARPRLARRQLRLAVRPARPGAQPALAGDPALRRRGALPRRIGLRRGRASTPGTPTRWPRTGCCPASSWRCTSGPASRAGRCPEPRRSSSSSCCRSAAGRTSSRVMGDMYLLIYAASAVAAARSGRADRSRLAGWVPGMQLDRADELRGGRASSSTGPAGTTCGSRCRWCWSACRCSWRCAATARAGTCGSS